ncbi:MAG: peptide deformylase [Cyanobacteria bacterium J06554_6]
MENSVVTDRVSATRPVPEVLQLGDRRLRVRSHAVPDPTAPAVKSLIDRLVAIAQARSGVGIAAPQIAFPQRLFVVTSRPNDRYPDAPTMAPTALINPRITGWSEAEQFGWEGCLSVPGWRGRIRRAIHIEVAYTDRQGRAQQRVFSDFIARIIQHEHDHLNGMLFLDRVKHTQQLMSDADYWAQHR